MMVQGVFALLHCPDGAGVDVWSCGSPSDGPWMSTGSGVRVGLNSSIRQTLCQALKRFDQILLGYLLRGVQGVQGFFWFARQ